VIQAIIVLAELGLTESPNPSDCLFQYRPVSPTPTRRFFNPSARFIASPTSRFSLASTLSRLPQASLSSSSCTRLFFQVVSRPEDARHTGLLLDYARASFVPSDSGLLPSPDSGAGSLGLTTMPCSGHVSIHRTRASGTVLDSDADNLSLTTIPRSHHVSIHQSRAHGLVPTQMPGDRAQVR
jgi:hypothetical protein